MQSPLSAAGLAAFLVLSAAAAPAATLPAVAAAAHAPSPPKAPAPDAAPALVVRGATLIDGTGRRPVPESCVVCAGGRIVAVGQMGRVPIPAKARVLTAPKGSTLLPGLIDMHVHSTVQPAMMPYFLANGVTTVRDLGCAEFRLADLKRYRADAAAGKQVGPRLFLAGPPLDGFPRAASWFPGPGARTPEEAEVGVRKLASDGVDLIKLYRHLPLPAARAAVAEAHRLGLTTTWDYQWNHRYLSGAIDSGTDGLEHVYYSERAPREEYEELAEAIGARRLWFEPTLVAFRPPDVSVTQDPDFRLLPVSLTHFWNSLFWPMETDQEFAVMEEFVRLVHRHGGRILAGTDSPVKYSAPGFALHHEMRLLAECGLSPMEVIRAATQSAAQALHRENELGTIAPGRRADLLLVAGNPLKDLAALRRVIWVAQGGRVCRPASLMKEARASAPAVDEHLPPYVHGD